jgi:esterase/lipase
MYIKYNSQTKRYYIGNTASTAVSETNSAITVYDVTQREVKKVARQLTNQGYTEYLPDWTRDHDTYDDIREAGL